MTVTNAKSQRPVRRPLSLRACAVGVALGLSWVATRGIRRLRMRAQRATGAGVVCCDMDASDLDRRRTALPALSHRVLTQ